MAQAVAELDVKVGPPTLTFYQRELLTILEKQRGQRPLHAEQIAQMVPWKTSGGAVCQALCAMRKLGIPIRSNRAPGPSGGYWLEDARGNAPAQVPVGVMPKWKHYGVVIVTLLESLPYLEQTKCRRAVENYFAEQEL